MEFDDGAVRESGKVWKTMGGGQVGQAPLLRPTFQGNGVRVLHELPLEIGQALEGGQAGEDFAAAILLEAGLSFLGLGVQPPAPSWGLMVKEGYDLLGTAAGLWLTLLPGTAISLLVLSFNLLGNGLRDAYDPKTPVAG